MLMTGGLGLVAEVQAQSGPSLRSDRQPVRVALDPTYQYYRTSEEQLLTEASTRLSVFVPVTQGLSVRARAGYARMGGDGLRQVKGPTDVAGQVTYARQIGDGSVVLSVGANAPTGKQQLTDEELQTTRPISQNYYDFNVTSFSRGPSVSPQLTVAYPITDRLAVGIGGAYQHQRGFQPNASLASDSLYVPGDGVGGNVGVNYKITQSSAVGISVTYRRYEEDRVDGAPRFDAGRRMAGTLRYLQRSGFTTVRAVLRYSQWEKSEFGFRNGRLTEQGQVIPPHGLALVGYQTRLTDGFRVTTRVSGHVYRKTIAGGRQAFGRLYLSPSISIGDALSVEPHGTVTYGSYLGLGGGLRIVGSF